MRIAMWSGPRNLSTAMMYSFAQRKDFAVADEPFYGPYLRRTDLDHPMRAEILATRPDSAELVAQRLVGPIPDGKNHAYHKHMCQHMIPGMPRSFMSACTNVFLIRHPARVVASFAKKYPEVTFDDVGFWQQAELFEYSQSLGQSPIVIDSADIRDNPKGLLRALCTAVGLQWNPCVLAWPKGARAEDGVWASHWYKSVHQSTGFAGGEGPLPNVADHADLVAACLPHYEKMAAHKLRS